MSFNPQKVTIPGLPDQIVKNIRIGGQTEVVDTLLKRVVLINRTTLQLIAARNVSPDNTWEMYAPDQGAQNHLLIGTDEGANFNVSAFDRVSMGTKTYNFPVETYGDILSSAEAFYVADVFYTDLSELPAPVMLPGELALDKPVSDLFFIEDIEGTGRGHFENSLGETVVVGRPQDSIKEGTKLVIGGWTYTIHCIQNDGNGTDTVKLDGAVSVADPDILGDGSCVVYMPMEASWVDATGGAKIEATRQVFIPFHQANYDDAQVQVVRDFTGIKTLTIKAITTAMTYYVRNVILYIPGVLEIGLYHSSEVLYVDSWVGGYDYENFSVGPNNEAFISLVFEAGSLKIYVNDTATPKKTLSAYTLSSFDSVFLYGATCPNGVTGDPDNEHLSIWDFRAFNKELTSSEMDTVAAGAFSSFPYPVAVSDILNAQIQNGTLSLLENLNIPYTSNFEHFSPFYGTTLNTLVFEKKAQLWHAPLTLAEVAGNIINVPGDYTGLQDAIDAAQNNDVIKIQPGTYPDLYTINGKIVHLYGDTDDPSSNRVDFSYTNGAIDFYFTGLGQELNPTGAIPVFCVNLWCYQNYRYRYSVRFETDQDTKIELNFINSLIRNYGHAFYFNSSDYVLLRMLQCQISRTHTSYDHFAGLSDKHRLIIEKCQFLESFPLAGTSDPRILIEDFVISPIEGYGMIEPSAIPRQIPTQIKEINPIYFSIPAATVDEDIQGVQMPIDLSLYPDIFGAVSGVNEIAVIFQDGSILNAEAERWDAEFKKGLLWVNLPYVSSATDTHYAIVYPYDSGTTGTLLDDIIHAVWDDFLFAYHMGYDPVGTDSCKDSTANENHATPLNMAPGNKSFALLGAYEYSYDGADQYLNAGNLLPEKTLGGALEIVFKTSQTQGFLFSQDADGWNDRDTNIAIGKPTGISNTITDGHLVFESKGPEMSETNHIVSTAPVNDNAYHHAALSWYRDNLGLTLDGVLDVPQIEYKMWGADGSTDIQIGTNGTGFFNGSINDVMLSTKFHSAVWHEMFNKNLNGTLVQYAEATDWLGTWTNRIPLTIDHTKIDSDLTHFPVPISLSGTDAEIVITAIGGLFSAKSFIIDIADNWGDANVVGVRQIDFWYKGSKLPLIETDFTAYRTTQRFEYMGPELVFDTTTSKTGGTPYNEWSSAIGSNTNQRLICVFNSPIVFDEIRVNNSHDYGNYSNRGAKNVAIHVSTDEITNTTYASAISNSAEIFNGQLTQHVASNVEDEETVIESSGDPSKKIAVALSNKTQLYCEVEQWDAVGNKITLWASRSDWVISSTEDAVLYLYYDGAQTDNDDYVGDPGSVAAQNVWNSDFVARYGMAQDPSGGANCIIDSTSNANHGTPGGSMTSADLIDGNIGKALEFDGTDDHIQISGVNKTALGSTFSIALTVNPAQYNDAMFQIADSLNNGIPFLNLKKDDEFSGSWYFDSNRRSLFTLPLNEYSRLVLTYDGTTWYWYRNGVLDGSVIAGNSLLGSAAWIGNGYSGYCGGAYSDFMSAGIALNTDWIKADYHAQTNTLLTAGTAEEFGGVAEVPWTPTEITTALWLDAADETTITIDTGVSEWNDKSGNSRNAVQSTGSLQPAVVDTAINDLPVLEFSATGQNLELPDLSSAFSSGATIFAVLKTDTDPPAIPNSGLWRFGGTSSNTHYPYNNGVVYDGFGSTSRKAIGDPGVQLDSPRIYSVSSIAGDWTAWWDGLSVYNTTDNTVSFSSTPILGRSCAASPARNYVGQMGEVIIVTGVPSVLNRQKIEGYLAHKWGLEANLPSDHSYKTSAPIVEETTPTWTPAETTTALWLDAADETTLTLDASDNVEQWDDKSGNNRHATQANATKLPSYTPNGIDFPSGKSLDSLSWDITLTEQSVFVVFKPVTLLDHGRVFTQSDSDDDYSTSNHFIPILRNNALDVFCSYAAGNCRAPIAVSLEDTVIFEVIHSGSEIHNLVDGANDAVYTHALNKTFTRYRIGESVEEATPRYFGGNIMEVLVLPGAALLEERQKIEGYLAHKWGLETNLPADHPYKSAPPESELAPEATGSAPIIFNASQAIQNLPVKIDLSATSGPDSVDLTSLIDTAFTNLQVSCNGVQVSAEAAYWVSATRAIIWALIPETLVGENSLALEYLETASETIGGIGSTVGQEVWQDFEAVYHLYQDPAVGILDSTGNHANAVPANMDATNLVDAVTVFNGTDEAINIGNIFDTQQDKGQAHVGFKTAVNSGVILSQGDSDMVLDASGNLVVTGTQTETSLDVLSDDAWHGTTFAFHRGKRDFFVDGVDQIPYGLFGSDGISNVLIGGHYTVGAAFTGNIVDVRLNNNDPGHQALSLRGKMWKEILDPTGDHIDMIPIFSFDQGSTYKIWTGSAWRAVVSNDETVHGATGDTDWYYRDNADTWSKTDATDFNDAASLAVEYPNNQNDTLTIEGLTSAEWSATGGMTSDGHFDMTFVFWTPIQGLYSAMSDVYADGGKQVMSQTFDLEPFSGKVTGSKIEWKIKISDTSYDYSGVKVYACLTGGTWTECTRNDEIPGITAGMDTTGLTLQFKIVTPVDFPAGSNVLLTPKIF